MVYKEGRVSWMEALRGTKKLVNSYLLFSLITSLVGLGLAITVTSRNAYVAFPWYLSNLMALAFAAIGMLRLRSLNDPSRYGVIAIQHSWWVLSVGLAGVLFYLAPYFVEVAGVESWTMFVISLIWLLWGFYVVFAVNKSTKAPIAP
jgi:hypothetical protein